MTKLSKTTLFLLFFLLTTNIYSLDYRVGFSANFKLPTEIKILEITAKCGSCVKDHSLEFETGVTFKNKIIFSETWELNFDLSYDYSLIKLENKKEKASSIALNMVLNMNFDVFFVGAGIFWEKYISNDFYAYKVIPISGIINLGYNFSDNFGLLISTKIFKMVNNNTKTRGYLLNNFSMFYYF